MDGLEDYQHLEAPFMNAVKARNRGDDDRALQLFREVLSEEPRMPEPRLETAMILFQRGALDEAEAQAREALTHLENGWRWLDGLTDEQLLAHCCNLIAEILKARIGSDSGLECDDETLRAMWHEASALVSRAVELDPENEDALHNYHGFQQARSPLPRKRKSAGPGGSGAI